MKADRPDCTPNTHTCSHAHTSIIIFTHQHLLFPEPATLHLQDQRRKQQALCVCVCACVWCMCVFACVCVHLNSCSVSILPIRRGGVVGGVHTACLKNSSTTSGAVLGVCGTMCCRLSLSAYRNTPHPIPIPTNIHTHTKHIIIISDPPVHTLTCLLSAFIQRICPFPRRTSVFQTVESTSPL